MHAKLPTTDHDAPTRRASDVEEERQRLLSDAEAVGVDAEQALALAADLAHTHPEPDALRAVDRRLATGYTIDEARTLLVGGSVARHHAEMTAAPDAAGSHDVSEDLRQTQASSTAA